MCIFTIKPISTLVFTKGYLHFQFGGVCLPLASTSLHFLPAKIIRSNQYPQQVSSLLLSNKLSFFL